MANTLVGQVLSVGSGDRIQYYLARSDDLLPITPLEQALTLADPATAAAYPGATPTPVPVGAALVAAAKQATRPERTDVSQPEQLPAMAAVTSGSALCATFHDAGSPTGLVYNVTRASDSIGIATSGKSSAALADRVLVPPGYGAVVQSLPSPDSPVGQLYLVTDQGRLYLVPNAAELAWFGYGSVQPLVLPSELIARMPAGPSLDPAAAIQPVPAG